MNIFAFGGPGSGKGTQAKLIVAFYNDKGIPMTHFSSGDEFRRAAEEFPDSELAKAMERTKKGPLVPDSITCPFINKKLEGLDSFVLDGYPRTIPQAQNLEEQGIHPDLILYYSCPEDVLLDRMTSRWLCRAQNHIYNSMRHPDVVSSKVCPVDGSLLYQRGDDIKGAKERIKVFFEKTEPTIEWYRKHPVYGKIFHLVDGVPPPNEIFKNTMPLLK